MVSKQSILGDGSVDQISASFEEMKKMIVELKELVMNQTPIANSSSDQHRPPPAPPHPQPHPFYSSEFSPPSFIPQHHTIGGTAPQVFDEYSVSCVTTQTPAIYTSPYNLAVQTTLSTGQPFYVIESAAAEVCYDNASLLGELSPFTWFNTGCEVGVNEVEIEDRVVLETIDDVCEADDKLEAANESAVKPDFEEAERLEARVACEVAIESEMNNELGVDQEDKSVYEDCGDTCEIDYETETEAEVSCEDEVKNEVDTIAERLMVRKLSRNVMDTCPEGLTSKSFALKAQMWELKSTESIAYIDTVSKNIQIDRRVSEAWNNEYIFDKTSVFYDGLKRQPSSDPMVQEAGFHFKTLSWRNALGVAAGIFERKDKDAMFSFVEATYKQQDRVRTLFDTGWNTLHQKHIHNDKFEGVITTYRQVGELFNPSAALKSVFSAAKIERLGNWFTDGSDPRWCCTYLLDTTDPLFIEIGKAFIRQIFDPGGQVLEVTRCWRDVFWSVMFVAYLICLGVVLEVLRLNRFRKNRLNMDRYISKILENHEGLTEDY